METLNKRVYVYFSKIPNVLLWMDVISHETRYKTVEKKLYCNALSIVFSQDGCTKNVRFKIVKDVFFPGFPPEIRPPFVILDHPEHDEISQLSGTIADWSFGKMVQPAI